MIEILYRGICSKSRPIFSKYNILCVWLALFPLSVQAQTISDKKAALSQKYQTQDSQLLKINQELSNLKSKLRECYEQVTNLHQQEASEKEYKQLLDQINRTKIEIKSIEESWHQATVGDAKTDEEGYALWNEEETNLAALVMDYGSLDYLYIVPTELTSVKLNLFSNIPIPRESWSSMLDVILMHNGIGVKKINTFAKQLFILKQDLGTVQSIASKPADLDLIPNGSRVFYVCAPQAEQARGVFQFFERFSDSRQTFVYHASNKIILVASKEEIVKLLALYKTIWEEQEGKIAKVLSVSKMNVKEMEKILHAFFGEGPDKPRISPFGRSEQDHLNIFSLGQSSNLVLIGQKSSVERAERLVRETEEQLENPTEMTVFLYTCKHSDPTDLAKILEKVYLSLLNTQQEDVFREEEIAPLRSAPTNSLSETYPSPAPLAVSHPNIKVGTSLNREVEEIHSEHFIPDPKSGTLLMTVRRDSLVKIKELLKKIDIPKKMVQLEVLLFERRLTSQNNFGLNLLKIGNTQGANYTSSNGSTFFPGAATKGVFQFFFKGGGKNHIPHFDIAYNFLMAQEDVQLNASPSIITVNQTPATVSIVEEISINNGAAPLDTGNRPTFERSFSRAQYGIIITLTPTIHTPDEGEKGLVTLKTNITFDTTKANANDRPLVDRRHIENEVRVTDGETIILGGLRRKSKQDVDEKIPFLGEIPGIGRLFGTTQLTDNDTEMFFFITPKIIYDSAEELERARLETLKKRPGDIPEFLVKIDQARDLERTTLFNQSLKLFFKHDR